jgi:hypothetical protein
MRSYFEIENGLICHSLEFGEIYCINTDAIEADCEGVLSYNIKLNAWKCDECKSHFKTIEIVHWIADKEIDLYLQ